MVSVLVIGEASTFVFFIKTIAKEGLSRGHYKYGKMYSYTFIKASVSGRIRTKNLIKNRDSLASAQIPRVHSLKTKDSKNLVVKL